MYWMVMTSLMYVHVFGTYAAEGECKEAAEQAAKPWYVSARCVPLPKQQPPAAPPR